MQKLNRLARWVVVVSVNDFAARRRILRDIHRKKQALLYGEPFKTTLRKRKFWVWLAALHLDLRPKFYALGIPMAMIMYAWGVYGVLRG